MITRRGLIGGILAVGCAPAIVRASNIMPVKPIDDWYSIIQLDVELSLKRMAKNHYTEIVYMSDFGTLRLELDPQPHWIDQNGDSWVYDPEDYGKTHLTTL